MSRMNSEVKAELHALVRKPNLQGNLLSLMIAAVNDERAGNVGPEIVAALSKWRNTRQVTRNGDGFSAHP